jgi:hypothetical protein
MHGCCRQRGVRHAAHTLPRMQISYSPSALLLSFSAAAAALRHMPCGTFYAPCRMRPARPNARPTLQLHTLAPIFSHSQPCITTATRTCAVMIKPACPTGQPPLLDPTITDAH